MASPTNYFIRKDRNSYDPLIVYINRLDENQRRRLIRAGWKKMRRDDLIRSLGAKRVEQLRANPGSGVYRLNAAGWTFEGDDV